MSAHTLDLFSGIGGMALGVHRVCPSAVIWKMCDIDPKCRELFLRRFGDRFGRTGWGVCDDVRSLRGCPFAGVSLVYGGFPCQDVSTAGKRAGVVSGERSSLFGEMIRLGVECRAAYIFLENVAALQFNGLDEVKARLREAGWSEIRVVVCSADLVGARHRRRRIFILAHNRSFRGPSSLELTISPPTPDSTIAEEPPNLPRLQRKDGPDKKWVDAIRMLGNSCVPQQAELALRFMLGQVQGSGGVNPAATATTAWDTAWDQPWGFGADDVVPLYKIMPTRRMTDMGPTLIAYDCFGGRNARRRPDGTYGSMTLAKWVRHNPDHGTWGSTERRVVPIVPGHVVSVEWATWYMGFPPQWLEMNTQ